MNLVRHADRQSHASAGGTDGASAPLRPARGAEAFAPGCIEPYPLPGEAVAGLNKVHWPVATGDAVLLIHDAQLHWVRMFANASPWLAQIERLRDASDAAGIPCIYTTARRPRNAAERGLALSLWGLGVASCGDEPGAAEIVEPLRPRPSDFVIAKNKYSAFFDTELEALLRRLGRRQILLTGVFGHHGVMLTAADAYMRNLQVLLIADAMADYSLAEHLQTVHYVAEVCGCVMTASQAVAGIEGRR